MANRNHVWISQVDMGLPNTVYFFVSPTRKMAREVRKDSLAAISAPLKVNRTELDRLIPVGRNTAEGTNVYKLYL